MSLHQPIHFDDQNFSEIPLANEPEHRVRHALAALLESRAFFLTGAGASAAAPTGLPTGPQLARKLVEWARYAGYGAAIDGVADESDLGSVCEAVEADAGPTTLRPWLVGAEDWEGAPVNLGHFAVALLFAEGIVKISFTANWDTKGEHADGMIESDKRLRFPHDTDTMNVAGGDPLFVHIHGCCRAPDSLVAKNADLDEPGAMSWSDPNLRAALSTQDPILVGFAAEPTYVVRSLQEMGAEMGRPPASVIGLETLDEFRDHSPALASALKLDTAPDRYVKADACEALGELMRCCYRKLLGDLLDEAAAKARACAHPALSPITGAEANMRALLCGHPVAELLSLLWHSAARPSPTGSARQRPLNGCADKLAECLAAVMLVDSCADASGLQLVRGGFRVARNNADPIDLWPLIPDGVVSTSDAQARAYRRSDRFSGPSDANVPLVLICAGTVGAVPATSRVALAGTGSPASVSAALRAPSDVLTLEELDRRAQTVTAPGPAKVEDLLQL